MGTGRQRNRWAGLAAAALMVAGTLAGSGAASASTSTTGSFTFATAGDHGSASPAATLMQRVGAENPSFFLSLGDLSYDTIAPASWCTFVKDNINRGAGKPAGDQFGETFRFPLVQGNHETHNFDEYLPCLPDRMGSTVMPGSTHGRDYYFDHPATAPLARFIVMSPGLEYTFASGSPEHTWLSNSIDQARAAGIKWVIVANHMNYITTGSKVDQIGSAFFNTVVSKKVDLLLQGHEHDYQRSHQLAHGSGCTRVPTNTVNSSCIAASGNAGGYEAGKGTVLVISGLGGRPPRTVNPSDTEAGYFAVTEGNADLPTYGYNRIEVTADALTSTFVNTGTTAFADRFTIGRSATSPALPPVLESPTTTTKTFTAVADATVRQATPTTNDGATTSIEVDASPVEEALLKFSVTGTEGYTVRSARIQMQVTNPSTSGGRLHRTAATGWDERTVTWSTAPAADATALSTLGAVTTGTWVEHDATSAITGDGTYSFRTASSSTDGAGYGSRESTTGKPRLVLTLEPKTTTPTTKTFTAVADATVRQATPTTNDGATTSIEVDASPVEEALLKFSVTGTEGYTVRSARIQMQVTNPSTSGGRLHRTAATGWDERTVTWSTAPAADATALSTLGAVTTGTWVEHDATSAITGDGTYSFRTASSSTDGAGYGSRESTTGKPRLVLTLEPKTTTPTTTEPAPTQTTTLLPADDATVESGAPATNYGTQTTFGTDGEPLKHALVKFNVTGLGGAPVKSAKLRLHVANGSDKGGHVHPVADTLWSERTVTWQTAPAAGATKLAELGPVTTGQWQEIDLSSHITAEGVYSFRITDASTDGAYYTSKEATGNRSHLVLTY
ncbi:calcineurin-like phosphoesterase family protein [Kineococcus xinjiangensis]|uniref:Calcineurin-like phosphoesterase family protein n=1 Tax=Kineococcus xinjiangensis TaxID=512762 RepID=A0A2S6IGP1_9ACTN|nr:DNRLRE domain-containing protein [Kineococcus xinjiangensis]PPK93379.1 calcineurin-like phosphoesterase family protein [Kineococcus xinjiangensis]